MNAKENHPLGDVMHPFDEDAAPADPRRLADDQLIVS